MKSLSLLLIAGSLISACATTPGTTLDTQRTVSVAESSEGHTFHFIPINEKGVTDVTVMLAFPTRWAFTQGLNQSAPYVGSELIMNGQTRTLKPQDIMELFNDKNARGVVFARPDHVIGKLDFPIEHASEIVPVASELLSKPIFEQRWVDRIKQNMRQNSQNMQTQTNQLMFEAARAAIIQNEPLRRSLSTNVASELDQLTENDILQWHAQTFTQADVTVSVAGAVTQEQAGDIVDSLLSPLPEGDALPAINVPTDFSRRTVLFQVPQAEKTTLTLIGHLPSKNPTGDMSDLILLGQFAQPGSGPLFDALRTKLRATYGFEAGFANYDRGTRLLYITGEVETDVLAQVVEAVQQTYSDYRAGALNDYQEYQTRLAQGTAENLKYVDVSAQTLLELAIDKQDTRMVVDVDSVFDEITRQQLTSRLAQDFPDADELLIVAASSDASALPGACVITSVDQITECSP